MKVTHYGGGLPVRFGDGAGRSGLSDSQFETVRLGVRITGCKKDARSSVTFYDLQLEVVRPPNGTMYDEDPRYRVGAKFGHNEKCFATDNLGMEPQVGDILEVDLVRRRSDDLYIIQNPKRLEPQSPGS